MILHHTHEEPDRLVSDTLIVDLMVLEALIGKMGESEWRT